MENIINKMFTIIEKDLKSIINLYDNNLKKQIVDNINKIQKYIGDNFEIELASKSNLILDMYQDETINSINYYNKLIENKSIDVLSDLKKEFINSNKEMDNKDTINNFINSLEYYRFAFTIENSDTEFSKNETEEDIVIDIINNLGNYIFISSSNNYKEMIKAISNIIIENNDYLINYKQKKYNVDFISNIMIETINEEINNDFITFKDNFIILYDAEVTKLDEKIQQLNLSTSIKTYIHINNYIEKIDLIISSNIISDSKYFNKINKLFNSNLNLIMDNKDYESNKKESYLNTKLNNFDKIILDDIDKIICYVDDSNKEKLKNILLTFSSRLLNYYTNHKESQIRKINEMTNSYLNLGLDIISKYEDCNENIDYDDIIDVVKENENSEKLIH